MDTQALKVLAISSKPLRCAVPACGRAHHRCVGGGDKPVTQDARALPTRTDRAAVHGRISSSASSTVLDAGSNPWHRVIVTIFPQHPGHPAAQIHCRRRATAAAATGHSICEAAVLGSGWGASQDGKLSVAFASILPLKRKCSNGLCRPVRPHMSRKNSGWPPTWNQYRTSFHSLVPKVKKRKSINPEKICLPSYSDSLSRNPAFRSYTESCL